MPDYSKGKIYTLRCKYDTTMIYVGSTINPLYKRLGSHKGVSKQEDRQNKLYKTVNEDWDNWYIELYELYPCVNVEELRKREGEVIRLIGNLNSVIAGRTGQEYRLENVEKKKSYDKEYNVAHKEQISEKNKKNRENTVEHRRIQTSEYRQRNQEKLKESIPCDKCGQIGRRLSMSRHKKSIKCINFTPE